MTKWDAQLQLQLAAGWTVIPLYSSTPLKIQRGTAAYGSWPRPAEILAELNNDTLAYDPERPESPLYGVGGRSTPARILVGTGGSLVLRSQVEAWGYKTVRTPDHQPGASKGRSSVLFTGMGPLQRIGAWTDLVASPMMIMITGRSSLIGHWPMDEDVRASVLGNTVAGATSGTIRGGAVLGESDRPAGARQTVKSVNGCQLAGTFLAASASAGWQIVLSFKAAALPAAGVWGSVLRWTTSNGNSWLLEFTLDQWRLTVSDPVGAQLFRTNIAYVSWPPTQWVTFRVRATTSGSSVIVEPAWYVQGAQNDVGVTGSFTGTVGALRSWWHDGTPAGDASHLCHIYAMSGTAENANDLPGLLAFNGYEGETAGDRFIRIVQTVLPGLTAFVAGPTSETPKMGPQPVASLIDILRDIRDTDGGRIDDAATARGLNFRTLRAMRGQSPKLTLSYPAQIMRPFETDPSSYYVANTVTVKNRDGGEATVSLTAGPMSTQLSPNGVGESKATINVNLDDEVFELGDRASWELARGTVGGRQWRTVTLSLDTGQLSVSAVNAVDVGDYIKITGYPPDDIHLWVVGSTETQTADQRTYVFDVESYEVMRVGTWSDGTWRWGLGQLALSVARNSLQTAWTVASPERFDLLTPGAVGIDVMVAGERVTIISAGAVTGTGPYTQTLTVTRSINGVIKAQLVNAPLVAVDARRWGL